MDTKSLKAFIISLLADKFDIIHRVLQKLEEDLQNLQNKISTIEKNSEPKNDTMINQFSLLPALEEDLQNLQNEISTIEKNSEPKNDTMMNQFSQLRALIKDEMKETRQNQLQADLNLQKMIVDIFINKKSIENFSTQRVTNRQYFESQRSQSYSKSTNSQNTQTTSPPQQPSQNYLSNLKHPLPIIKPLNEKIVFITKTGCRFHNPNKLCKLIQRTEKIPILLEEAKKILREGQLLTSCGWCFEGEII